MSPRYPSTDPRLIRRALADVPNHTRNQVAVKYGVQHHTIARWIGFREQFGPAWPTDADIAEWDAKAAVRARSAEWKRRYNLRRHLAGGDALVTAPHGTVRRLQALCAIGWTQGELGKRLGVSSSRVSNIIRLTRTAVRTDTAKAVAALYSDVCMKPPKGPTADIARADARRKGWPSPLAWDEDTIDDPNARPQGMQRTDRRHRHIVDDAAVELAVSGDKTVKLSTADRYEVVRRLRADQWSMKRIEQHTGVRADRYLTTTNTEVAA